MSRNTGDSGLVVSRNTTAAINSTLTFWPMGAPGSAVAQVDSIGHLNVGSVVFQQVAAPLAYTTGGQMYQSNDGLWPGEFMVKFNVASQDSSAAGNGKYGASPNTMLIPLVDGSGLSYEDRVTPQAFVSYLARFPDTPAGRNFPLDAAPEVAGHREPQCSRYGHDVQRERR